jgi:hypothetical protein
MKSLKELIDNPISWILILSLLQVGITFYFKPYSVEHANREAVIEKIEFGTIDTPELVNLFVTQQAALEAEHKTVEALISFQRTIGGVLVIVCSIYLITLMRRSRKNKQ